MDKHGREEFSDGLLLFCSGGYHKLFRKYRQQLPSSSDVWPTLMDKREAEHVLCLSARAVFTCSLELNSTHTHTQRERDQCKYRSMFIT